MQKRRAATFWAMQSAVVALVLVLLWQPAIVVAELKSQQNIIAVLVNDSRSMAIQDSGADGRTWREASALAVLQHGLLAGLQKRFQTRVYRIDGSLDRAEKADALQPTAAATHLGAGLKQLAMETGDLPVGAVVLLSDGADNTGGIDLDSVNALRNRRLPVHTISFGREQALRDVEMEDASLAPSAMAGSRVQATVRFRQQGYAGSRATLTAMDGEKLLASRDVVLATDGLIQAETLFFNAGAAGVRRVTFALVPLPGEGNAMNNALTRLVSVSGARRRILYVEGEPRWEYKFR